MSQAQVGRPAPAFTASVFDPAHPEDLERMVSLADYRGQWLVFFWYPVDFSALCPTEIMALSERHSEFRDAGCAVLGASTDSVYCHRAWADTPRARSGIAGLRYPLLSDMTHQVARDYGVLVEADGVALRGLFIIDPDGVIQHATINSVNVGRSVDETLRVLYAVQNGGLTPCDWQPGQAVLIE